MIKLTQVNGNELDLSVSGAFVHHYHKQGSFAKYILDNEINNGQWHDKALKNLPDDAVIVDVGMNVGMWTLYLEKKNRRFFGIEPCAHHIHVAKSLFDKFGYDVKIYEGVLYNKDGMVTLCEAPENTTSNRVGEGGGLKVESRKLATFVEENNIERIHLLKLDCEGSEKQIVLGGQGFFDVLFRCDSVFIETHVGDGYMTVEERGALIAAMCMRGFTCRESVRKGSYYFTR